MNRLENDIAIAVAGLGIFEIYKTYSSATLPLHKLTSESPDNDDVQASLVHADVLTGGLALVAGAWAAYHLRSVAPLVLALIVFGLVSVWHHRVLNY